MTRAYPETQLQKTVVQILRLRAQPNVVWWASTTGVKMSPRTASHQKSMGMLAGVSDLCFVIAGKFYGLELKAPKGRISPHQKEFARDIGEAGGEVGVAFNIEDAISMLESIGAIKPLRKAA